MALESTVPSCAAEISLRKILSALNKEREKAQAGVSSDRVSHRFHGSCVSTSRTRCRILFRMMDPSQRRAF